MNFPPKQKLPLFLLLTSKLFDQLFEMIRENENREREQVILYFKNLHSSGWNILNFGKSIYLYGRYIKATNNSIKSNQISFHLI